MKKLYFIITITLVACTQDYTGSSAQLTVELDTTYTTIGAPIFYTVSVQSTDDKIIQFPEWQLEDPLEIRSSEISISGIQKIGRFEIVFWDTGKVAIPGVTISVLNMDSTFAYDLTADTMTMEVVSITEKDPSFKQSGGGIMPIKDPVPVRFPLPWQTMILSILLLIIIIAIGLIWTKRLKADISYEERPEYLEDPDTVAMRKLNKLDQSELLTKGEIKEFYAQLSLILREYTENSLYIRTLEMTTEEIRENRSVFPYTDDQITSYFKILSSSDMAKYAKHVATVDQCIKDIAISRELVVETVPFWKIV
ncbi:MAG: hypothetical protein HN927_06440 [Candidatus Marinimicrobia bacterium]|nr:hypothetical protein [Candidatus Neomarinimicrobiota bacterium]MBT4064150.1 hypothetical protein [Candidatus Neomarinimicrobiota bacterium]MBT4307197.1 hypothetical protein [Candidatus Neomarinimicrobiota bacterium]MBT4453417.1 hypothetical protein [Candidatus Neomarinimicrobiota bacterium]MBT5385694.1 hypothetical protein [Candidatus Neomarinimicrobiota bacterium]